LGQLRILEINHRLKQQRQARSSVMKLSDYRRAARKFSMPEISRITAFNLTASSISAEKDSKNDDSSD
jgi:two-component sensor histidine kinase